MSEHLLNARGSTNEAASWLGDAIESYRQELVDRDGHDTGVHGGEISKAIQELLFLQSRIRRLHRESRILNRWIRDYQAEQDRLADLADAQSY
jgi:hypothetical protein